MAFQSMSAVAVVLGVRCYLVDGVSLTVATLDQKNQPTPRPAPPYSCQLSAISCQRSIARFEPGAEKGANSGGLPDPGRRLLRLA